MFQFHFYFPFSVKMQNQHIYVFTEIIKNHLVRINFIEESKVRKFEFQFEIEKIEITSREKRNKCRNPPKILVNITQINKHCCII
jgi:hypothetical protein